MPKSRSANAPTGESAAKKTKVVVKEWSALSAQERAAHIGTLTTKLKELGLTQIILNVTTSHTTPGQDQLVEQHESFSVNGFFPASLAEQHREFIEFAQKLVKDALEQSELSICVGEKAVADSQATSVSTNAPGPLSFGGAVTLLVFYTHDEVLAMKRLRALVDSHKAEWSGKVRVLCVSLDEESGDFTDDEVLTYFYKGEDAYVAWGCTKTSEYVLVDKQGKIAKRGEPVDFNVVQDISSCLAGKSLEVEEKKSTEGQWAALSEARRIELLNACGKLIKDGELEAFYLTSESSTSYSHKGETGSQTRLVVGGMLLTQHETVMVDILKRLHDAKVDDVEVDFQIVPKLEEDEGDEGDQPAFPKLPDKCQECQSALSGAAERYLCACCPAPYYGICGTCEGKRNTSRHPPYHVLFVVPPTGWSENCHFSVGDFTTFPVYGNAADPKEPEVFCDSCEQSLTGVRYDCIECPDDHDLCAACFDKQKRDNGPHSGHVWVKIHEPRGCRLTVDEEPSYLGGGDDEGDDEADGEAGEEEAL